MDKSPWNKNQNNRNHTVAQDALHSDAPLSDAPHTPTPPHPDARTALQAWRQDLVQGILRILAVLAAFAVLGGSYADATRGLTRNIPIYVGVYLVLLVITFWRRVSYQVQAAILLCIFYAVGVFSAANSGLSGDGGIFLLAFSAAAMLFFGRTVGLMALGLSMLSLIGLGLAFSTGTLVIPVDQLVIVNTDLGSWASTAAIFLMLGSLLVISQSRLFSQLTDMLTQSHTLTRELEINRAALERRVAERTRELERRNRVLEATAVVSREAAGVLDDPQQLLARVVDLVSEQFGFYHAGLFLIDDTGEWAVLQAASSEGGQRMLIRGHRLKIGAPGAGGVGTVGYVTALGEPRIAMDVGADAVFFDNPDLPETHSAMTLPLRARGEIIGALDVQSKKRGAFTEQDIAALQSLADQVAVAISNARLYQQAQQSAEAERRARGEVTRSAWQRLLVTQPDLGFLSDVRGTFPVAIPMAPPQGSNAPGVDAETLTAVQSGEPTFGQADDVALAMPIKSRGQVIGVIDAHLPSDGGAWTPERVALLETLSQQVGVALESAQLYLETQQRAAREQLSREVAANIRQTLNIDTVLQTAIREIGDALDYARVEVRLGNEDALSVASDGVDDA